MLVMPPFGCFNVATSGNLKEVSPTSKYPKIWIMYDRDSQKFRITTGEPSEFPEHELGPMHTGLPHVSEMQHIWHQLDDWGRILNVQINGPVGRFGPRWFEPLEVALALEIQTALTMIWRTGTSIPWVEMSLPKYRQSGWATVEDWPELLNLQERRNTYGTDVFEVSEGFL